MNTTLYTSNISFRLSLSTRGTKVGAARMRARRHWGFCLLVSFSLVLPLAAQEARTSAATNHTLWRVQGTNATVYLIGSIHMMQERDWPLAAPLETAFSNSQIVVFETDMEKMEQPETVMKLMAKANLPEGETLRNHLSAATYSNFVACVQKRGLSEAMFARFKPAMAAIVLTVLETQKLGFDPERGVDKTFFSRARKEGKEIVGLESVEFQIALMTEFTREEADLLMKSTVQEIETIRASLTDMMQAWRTGDAAALEKLLNESMRETPVIEKRLLTDRNRKWVPKIRELLQGNKPAVVIVGACHLVGREGVVELLRKEGFRITQQ